MADGWCHKFRLCVFIPKISSVSTNYVLMCVNMDQDDPVIQGFLLFPSQGNVLNKFKKKTCQQKFCMLFNSSKQGIARLEVYENKEDVSSGSCLKFIPLKNCIKISRTNANNINIVTKSTTEHLSTNTDDELVKWLKALQSVAFKEDSSSKDDNLDEDNDLYCSSPEGTFRVLLAQSEASSRCGLESTQYNLSISRSSVELINLNDNRVRALWPYKYIRRYGCRQGVFTLEAGRKCETGEGTFHFENCNHQEIFRCLSLKIKSMKKKMYTDTLHALDCDNQFQAALNMEPRSRSPLPLSSRTEDLNFNSISIKSSVTHLSIDSQVPLINNSVKSAHSAKPVKPPGKHIFSTGNENDVPQEKVEFGKYKKLESSESVSSIKLPVEFPSDFPYDSVEVRSDAWKTLGVNDVSHTELTTAFPDNNSIKLISRSQDSIDSCGEASKVTIIPGPQLDPCDANYDRLHYFTSASRTAKRSDNVYNLVIPTRSTSQDSGVVHIKDSWDDYDKVENVLINNNVVSKFSNDEDMQPARFADDSYLGYGMIRKPSIPGPQVPIKSKPVTIADSEEHSPYSDIDHCDHNGSEYAIVSKPKRV